MPRTQKFELGFAAEVITHNDKAVAVLQAPVDDDDLEGLLLARSPESWLAMHFRSYDLWQMRQHFDVDQVEKLEFAT